MMTDVVQFARVLADETRQEIMKSLCCAWLSVNEVVDSLGGKINQPTVSHHLKKLEEANLVTVRPEGRQRLYTLNRDQVTVCCGVLMHVFAPLQPGEDRTMIPIDQIEVRGTPDPAQGRGDLNGDQNARHAALQVQIRQQVMVIRELADGYALRLPGTAWLTAAEFTALDRTMCPTLRYALETDGDAALWLTITGPDNARSLIRAQLGL